jgi:type IV pilus modification protein PilV
MKTPSRSRYGRGFSLLEVLVAIVILSIGLLALAILQLNLIRSSTDAKAQSIGLALAKQQIETLRSFHTWPQYIAITDDSFEVTESGAVYTVDTEIQRYSLTDDGDPDTVDQYDVADDSASDADMSAAGFVPGRDFKRAAVTVTWEEASGAEQTVTLEDVIDGLVPADSARVAKNTAGSKPRNIQVLIHDPASEAGVIPIAIDTTSDPNAPVSTAATNPKPEVGGNNNNQRVYETRFDVLTYAGLNSGDFLAQARVETTVISCTCDADLADEDATGYRPTYWNGTRYVAPTLATYSQPAGWSQEGDQNPTESAKCNECCRDHHDPSGITGPKFDPRRVESSQGNQAHVHYDVADDGTLVELADSSNEYQEACRLIRVDGLFRVAADLYNDYFNLLEAKNDNSTSPFAPTSTAKTNYKNFVLDYLDTRITKNTITTTFNNLLAGSLVTGKETTHSLNVPASLTLASSATNPTTQGQWLHSRGLYIDYLEPGTVDLIEDAQEECVGDGTDPLTDAEQEACVLPLVPFTSINLTEIAKWSPEVDVDLRVTNRDFLCSEVVCSGVSVDSPVRGKAYAGTAPTDAATPNARSEILSSNAGVALLTQDIDDDTWNVTSGVSNTFDLQPFVISGGSGGNLYSFQVKLASWTFVTGSYPNLESQATGDVSVQGCSAFASNGQHPATCTLPAANPQAVRLTLSNYNSGATPQTSTNADGPLDFTGTNGCTGVDGLLDHSFSGTGQNTFNVRKCTNYQITGASVNGTALVSPVIGTGGTAGGITETSWIDIPSPPGIQDTDPGTGDVDTVIVTMAAETTVTKKPTACTYTKSCNNQACNNPTYEFTAGAPENCTQ